MTEYTGAKAVNLPDDVELGILTNVLRLWDDEHQQRFFNELMTIYNRRAFGNRMYYRGDYLTAQKRALNMNMED